MRAMRRVTRLRLTLPAVVAMLLLVSSAVYAATTPAKPGITVQLSPSSQSVQRGQSGSYTVTLTSTGGFVGPVVLSVSGLPSGTAASFTPSSATLSNAGTATSTMTVSTTASTPVGSFSLTVTGTSGKVSGSATAGLTVNYPLSGSLSLTATPATATMSAGSTAAYTLQLTKNGIGDVALGVVSGMPSGATATFNPNPVSGTSATLQVATVSTVADGTYTLYLVASGKDTGGTTRYAYANVQLVISTSTRPFTMSGNLAGQLSPGTSFPLDLTLSNPNNKNLSVTNLTVTVGSVTAPNATLANPCDARDYAITQYTGPYPLIVPGLRSASLSQLNVPVAQRPQVRMVNRPLNQDGCKSATVQLAYSGSGEGN